MSSCASWTRQISCLAFIHLANSRQVHHFCWHYCRSPERCSWPVCMQVWGFRVGRLVLRSPKVLCHDADVMLSPRGCLSCLCGLCKMKWIEQMLYQNADDVLYEFIRVETYWQPRVRFSVSSLFSLERLLLWWQWSRGGRCTHDKCSYRSMQLHSSTEQKCELLQDQFLKCWTDELYPFILVACCCNLRVRNSE